MKIRNPFNVKKTVTETKTPDIEKIVKEMMERNDKMMKEIARIQNV